MSNQKYFFSLLKPLSYSIQRFISRMYYKYFYFLVIVCSEKGEFILKIEASTFKFKNQKALKYLRIDEK